MDLWVRDELDRPESPGIVEEQLLLVPGDERPGSIKVDNETCVFASGARPLS